MKILILGVVSGVKEQKMVQNDKKKLFVVLHISGTTHGMIVIYLCYTTVTNNISRHFFHFFKILILWIVGGVKGQKMVQNDKTFCLSYSISQEPYIWLWFLVHMCKIMESPAIFSFFKSLIFGGFLGGKRAKKYPKLLM